MTAFGKLLFATVLKRAALLEEFISEHRLHGGPTGTGPHITVDTPDCFTSTANCPCGMSFAATVAVSVHGELTK